MPTKKASATPVEAPSVLLTKDAGHAIIASLSTAYGGIDDCVFNSSKSVSSGPAFC